MDPKQQIPDFLSLLPSDPAALSGYDLCLQLAEKEVSFSLFDTASRRYLWAGKLGLPPEEALATAAWLKGPFRSVRIIVENNRSTLIPLVLFDPAEAGKYLSLTVDQEPGDPVLFDRLPLLDIVSVYTLPYKLENLIRQEYPASTPRHLSSLIINAVWTRHREELNEAPAAFLNVRQRAIDLMVFNAGGPVYFNAFPQSAIEEIAYYLIFVFEQLGLDPNEIPVTLYGEVELPSPLISLLSNYIRNLNPGRRSDHFGYGPAFRTIPEPAFFSLLNPEP